MKIVYMGTPDFAVGILEALVNEGHQVVLVLTQPDKEKNRGKKLLFPPVKEKALELGLEVAQPYKLTQDRKLIDYMKALKPDLGVVAAYGQILSQEILDIPREGFINIHGSILPKLRGASPIQHSILNGFEKTGITIMKMERGLDSGPMMCFRETSVDGKNSAELERELSAMGSQLVVEAIETIEKGEAKYHLQNNEEATYAPLISKSDGELDFSKSSIDLERQIRAFNPWPGSFTKYEGINIKFWKGEVIDDYGDQFKESLPGEILKADDEGIKVKCGKGTLNIKEIQIAGKKTMKVKEYLKGNKIEVGKVFHI